MTLTEYRKQVLEHTAQIKACKQRIEDLVNINNMLISTGIINDPDVERNAKEMVLHSTTILVCSQKIRRITGEVFERGDDE